MSTGDSCSNKKAKQLTAKMTPEMCKAIKRHERTAGFDYWKAGFSGLNASSLSSPPDKRQTFQKMTQINLDFPGIFLTNVDGSNGKSKRKEEASSLKNGFAQPLTLNRSKSSLMPTVTKRKPVERPPRKHGLTDLTCLQLTDTLMSYTNTSFSGLGFFRNPLLATRSRYGNYLADEQETHKNTDTEEDSSSALNEPRFSPQIVDNGVNNDVQYENDRCEYSKSSYRLPSPKPQKSILKNKTSRISAKDQHEETTRHYLEHSAAPIVCSYQLPSSKTSIVPSATAYSSHSTKVTLESIRPRVNNNGYVYNSLRRHQSAKSNSKNTDNDTSNTLTEVVNGLNDRKRIVRFNAAHQVHEYTPCKPVLH